MATRSPIDGRPYTLDTSRARLTLDYAPSVFRAHADYDQEVLAGSYFRTKDYRLFGLDEPPTWLDLDQTITDSATHLWRHRLYRGYAGLEGDSGALLLGRQRVAWGTGKIWNPTDVLNPYQPTTVERDERRGVDAAYGRVALGELSQAELAYAPQDRWVDSALLARVKSNALGYDFSAMGGKVAGSTSSWMAGGDFAGNFCDGTLHGELAYVARQTRTPYWKADAGWDYSFADDTRVPGMKNAAFVFEYLHSGAGSTDTSKYRLGDVLSGREVTLAQDYFGVTLSKDLHPLVKLDAVWLTNLDDGSTFAGPSLTWNALDNLYLTAALQRFGGPKRTEFGRPANLSYLQAQYYF